MTKYFVKNGNTLGYTDPSMPNMFGVLQGSVLLGGDDWFNGPVCLTETDVLVPATKSDFDRFRVDSQVISTKVYAS